MQQSNWKQAYCMFAEEDQLLIKLRGGIGQPLTVNCNHHEKYSLYVTFQYKCLDPLLLHKNHVKVRR